MTYDRIIWDFNGTLLDDVGICIEAADQLLSLHDLPPIATLENYHRVFGFPIIDYYRRIGFDFSKTDFSVLANEWVAIYMDKVEKAPLRDGMADVLREFSRLGIRQTVLSMTESAMLRYQLDLLKITELFDEVWGRNDIYASSKLSLAAEWREKHPLETPLYIGDTLHDAESAKIIGADCLLLAGGHENIETLSTSGLTILSSPAELLTYMRNNC